MTNEEKTYSVTDLGGQVRFDPIMRAYIVRIPESNVPSFEQALFVKVGQLLNELEYDATRKIYYNNFISADSIELVENGEIVVQ